MGNKIRIKRGLFANLKTSSLADGELAVTTDTNKIYTNKGEVNPNNVYVGTSAPSSADVDVWVNPQGTMDRSSLIDIIYPIGAVYFSVSNINPSTLFGGTWQQITGYYLYAGTGGTTAGNLNTSAATGSTAGPSNNTSGSTAITVNQMPSHTHNVGYLNSSGNYVPQNVTALTSFRVGSSVYTPAINGVLTDMPPSGYTSSHFNQSTGGSAGHTHTLSSHTHGLNSHTHTINPTRFELYCWKRIS